MREPDFYPFTADNGTPTHFRIDLNCSSVREKANPDGTSR